MGPVETLISYVILLSIFIGLLALAAGYEDCVQKRRRERMERENKLTWRLPQ